MRIDERTGAVYSDAQMLRAGLRGDDLIWFTRGTPLRCYPVAQFDVLDGRLVARRDLHELWVVLGAAGLGRLARWVWITGPKPALDDRSPLECLGRWREESRLEDLVDRLVTSVLAA